ncbi:ATP-binding cassette domain-containing protein [Sediminibacillus terrae]|uniref:ATP-binding cassette domain-containing protein n=1 Tax=Sediminibacillus terrae TaxID=1562106 RepID=UPI0013866915|nr:ATP-binding cassette domain-containing protein [Sediminibacillus terrae]
MENPIVKLTNVSKTYNLYRKKSDILLDMFSFNQKKKTFSALKNISFEVFKGETIGIIGINGSGKSTLSNILAEIAPPTSGEITVKGDPSLVAISAGLNNFVTGRENIELKCLMHGLKKKEIEEITPAIIDFADLGDFIDQPIKSYSSGMKSRLGFAISVHVQPDILVVDEALSVGDNTFYQKCTDKFDEFKAQGKTIFFISHSLPQVQSISDKILWLNFGRVELFGETKEVAEKYKKFTSWFNSLSNKEKKEYRYEKLRNQISNGKEEPVLTKRYARHRKKNHSKHHIVQLSILLLLFLFSTFLMFIENPLQALDNSFNNKGDEKLVSQVEKGEPVQELSPEDILNMDGWIIVNESSIYKNIDTREKVEDLAFGTKVNILEEETRQNFYKVEVNGISGYLSKNDLLIIDQAEQITSDLKIEDFIDIFPRRISNSYEFFISLLGSDLEELRKTTQGITNEYLNDDGQLIVEYSYENIAYITDNNKVGTLQINEIDFNNSVIEEIMNEAFIKSVDGTLYCLSLENYYVYLDSIQKEMKISLR